MMVNNDDDDNDDDNVNVPLIKQSQIALHWSNGACLVSFVCTQK